MKNKMLHNIVNIVTSDTFVWWFGIVLIIISLSRIKTGDFERWIMPLVFGVILAVSGVIGWLSDRKIKS